MPITEHPLRGSVRALLMHTALTCQKSYVKRIETVMLTLPRSVPIGKSQEISFINRIHDFHGRPLDKLVLNYWNAQGTLLAVGFVDEHSTHWLGFISSSFQSLREVLKIALQIFHAYPVAVQF